MKTTLRIMVAAVLVGLLAGPQMTPGLYAAASGHFTDLLPNPTSIGSSVTSGSLYYNGYDWQVATMAPSQTGGDSLSRTPMTVYQSTATGTIGNTTTVSTFSALGQGNVGSTTFPAAWIAAGRTIRITMRGNAGTTATPNWTWALALGTTTVLTTGAVAAPTTITSKPWSASALISIATTGANGGVNCSYDIFVTTAIGGGAAGGGLVSYSTATATPQAVDLTSQLTVNPTFTWGTANSANTITANNVLIEFLN